MRSHWTKFLVAISCLVAMVVVSVNQLSGSTDGTRRQLVTAGDPLRIAVFGSSHSWGATLEDRFMAYPYRLSPRVDNFAYFASGPNYPAVCTQSIIGNHAIYDLIILEYYVSGAQHGLAELARRLRSRFPEAIIIVMKFNGPFDALRAPSIDSEEWQDLMSWKKTLDLPNGQLNEFVNEIENDTGVWRFREHPNTDRAINRVVREIGGYQFHLPQAATATKTLVSYLRFFDKDRHQLLSARGHEWVADMCSQIVTKHILAHQKATRQVKRASVASWGKGDSCNIWWTTGGMPYPFSENLVLNQYDETRGKFALEITATGWLDIENPFHDDRTLYLSFLASDTPGTYPNGVISHAGGSFVLDTDAGGHDKHGVGIVRTIPVGLLVAGKTTRINVKPQSAGTTLPFRLAGATFTNGDVTPVEFNFGPHFNR